MGAFYILVCSEIFSKIAEKIGDILCSSQLPTNLGFMQAPHEGTVHWMCQAERRRRHSTRKRVDCP